MALPEYFADEYVDPTSNLAASPVSYRAYDGTPIGQGAGCDSVLLEPSLSDLFTDEKLTPRMFIPEVISENRIETGYEWALPLLASVAAYHQGATPLQTALWSIGAYFAPLPAAALLAYRLSAAGQMQPAW